jgi:hypothetical protein
VKGNSTDEEAKSTTEGSSGNHAGGTPPPVTSSNNTGDTDKTEQPTETPVGPASTIDTSGNDAEEPARVSSPNRGRGTGRGRGRK